MVFLAYIILYLVMPWDEEERHLVLRFPWRFAAVFGVLWAGNMWYFSILMPKFMNIFDSMGRELSFPMRLIIGFSDFVRNTMWVWFNFCFTIPILVLATYMAMPQGGKARTIFALAVAIGGLLLFGFCILALKVTVAQMATQAR